MREASSPLLAAGRKERSMTVASLLARKGVKVVTIQPEQQIRQALALLAEHNIGALVVVDPGARPIGILSERDIVRAAVRDERGVFEKSVSALMTRNVIVGVPQDDLTSVGHTMTEKRIRHLPVVEQGRLVGIISIGDVVKAQRDQYQGEVDTLQFQLIAQQAKPAARAG
jgi:CBS domain-containing protein